MEVDAINNEYFTSYEDLEVHELMILDNPRTQTYRKAIESCAALFKDKVVMDVGSGTGILSMFCAKAGAKTVFAVEASNIAQLSQKIIADNKLDSIISVFHGPVEDFTFPSADIRSVDIIVSEWMGFYLLHECMLHSVIFARDKFLKNDGLMFPCSASIYLSPCMIPSVLDRQLFEGVDLRSFSKELRKQKSNKPQIELLDRENLLHEGSIIAWIDLKEVSLEELDEFDVKEVYVSQKAGELGGFCIWWDVVFPSDMSEPITLSTSPKDPSTHWKQTLIAFPQESIELIEESGIPIAVQLKITRSKESTRRYNLQLEILDPEKEEHSIPCDCILTKCILTKQHLAAMEAKEME